MNVLGGGGGKEDAVTGRRQESPLYYWWRSVSWFGHTGEFNWWIYIKMYLSFMLNGFFYVLTIFQIKRYFKQKYLKWFPVTLEHQTFLICMNFIAKFKYS